MAGQLAVLTAILATVGALFSYMGGATQANAGLYKNDAAIKKTEAATALLTKKRWMEVATIAMGLVGIALGGVAWFHL